MPSVQKIAFTPVICEQIKSQITARIQLKQIISYLRNQYLDLEFKTQDVYNLKQEIYNKNL